MSHGKDAARHLRYGRRGGNWAATSDRGDECHTCRRNTARHLATNKTGDTYPICTSCAEAARRHRIDLTLRPLTETT